MFEIEAKVRLSGAQVGIVQKKVAAMAQCVKRTTKEDRYYDFSDSESLRLRVEGNEAFLQLKTREGQRGLESNLEMEFPIEGVAQWDRLLRANGFPLIGKKRKRSDTYRFGNCGIELNQVGGLGHFLEIECLVGSRAEIPKAKRGVVTLFKRLGFSPRDFEPKLYLELLAEKAKDKGVRKI